MKDFLRKIFIALKIDITKNIEYDRLTSQIFKNYLKDNSNCIDIGCHKGEILDVILDLSPKGNHFAFEPIPPLFNQLKIKYGNKVSLFDCALSDEKGETNFNYVKNAPAYSGIKQREYKVSNPEIEEIKVQLNRLDDLIPENTKIDLIKIDVEGAELGVLKGGKNLIAKNKPLILFECGLGASEFYNTKPEDVYNELSSSGLNIYTLKSYINKGKALSENQFKTIYTENSDYYFVATAD